MDSAAYWALEWIRVEWSGVEWSGGLEMSHQLDGQQQSAPHPPTPAGAFLADLFTALISAYSILYSTLSYIVS